LSLETVASNKSESSDKSQGSQKSAAKPKLVAKPKAVIQPKPKQPSALMPRSASKQVKEDELTPFHKDALVAAGGMTTPDAKGSAVV